MNPPPPYNAPRPSTAIAARRWTRIVAWFAIGCAALLLLIVVSFTVLLHNTRFHQYVITRVEQQASESLGVQVTLQNFTLNVPDLLLDLYGITVEGAAPFANPPLLQVEHAEVGLKVISIFRRQWCLDTLRVDHPVVKIFTDAQGRTNIPAFKSSGGSSNNTSVFDLGVRHAVLDQGQAFYNNRQSDLQADLQDLQFAASFDPSSRKYSGRLSYANGHLSSGALQQIPHSLDARFEATPDEFRLTQATLASGNSSLQVNADLRNYSQPDLQANYDAVVDGKQFQQTLKNSSVPAGVIRASGIAHYRQVANTAALDSLDLNGTLSSDKLTIVTPSLRTEATNLLAHYSASKGNAVLQDLRLNLLGGSVSATGKAMALAGDTHYQAHATLRSLSLRDLTRAARTAALPAGAALEGFLSGSMDATGGKQLDDLIANTDLTIDAGVDRVGPGAGTQGVPVNGAVHARYIARGEQVSLTRSYLRTPQTNLALDGVISSRSSLNVELNARDLHEIETIAAVLAPDSASSLSPLALSGTASFKGAVHGTVTAPELAGSLTAQNVSVRGTVLRNLRSGVEIGPSGAALQHADLQFASRGHISLDAETALSHWSFLQTSPLKVRLSVTDLSLADMSRLVGSQAPITGTLNADANFSGTEQSPQGQGTLSLSNLVAYEQPVDSAKLTFSGSGDEVHGNLTAHLISGDVQSQLSVHPRAKTYVAQLSMTGLQLDQLQAVKSKSIAATGILSGRASGSGSFDNPGVDATLTIPQLVVQGQTFANSTLHLNVANHLANANLTSNAVNSSLRASAKVSLAGDYLTDASIDTQAIPLQPILAVYAPAQAANLNGETEMHATLHGPLKDKSKLEAHVVVPVLKMAYGQSIQLAAASPIHIDYKNNTVSLQRVAIRGTDTDLQVEASFPVQPNPPISALLLGNVNLQLAQVFEPGIRSGGKLNFNLNSLGAPASGSIAGEVKIVDASFSSEDLPVGLQHANGTLTFTKDRLNISSFEGTVGGGKVTAQGGVIYQPAVQFDLGLAAQGVRILYPQGMREGLGANLRLTGSTETAQLAGTVSLSDVSFTPAFDLTNFIGQFSGGIAAPPSQGFSQNLQLNIAVRSTNDVNLVGRTVSINGSANLQVRGTAADPVILGRVNLNNGDVILNGERFVLNGGTIQFVNPAETQPVVNLSLYTTIQEYNVYLRFNGPIDQLQTNYSSDPALPSADIINLLAFGKTMEADAANPSTPANQAAESLIASQVSSQVTSRVSKIAGISQLSISPVLSGGTSQGPPGANITVQQRVTGNLFITFSSNVASTQNQTIQGQYQLTPRIAVSGTRDQNGGFAVDTLIKKSW